MVFTIFNPGRLYPGLLISTEITLSGFLALLVARDYQYCLRSLRYFFILELYDPVDRINLCERAYPRDVLSRFDALALSLLFEEYEHGDYRRFDL